MIWIILVGYFIIELFVTAFFKVIFDKYEYEKERCISGERNMCLAIIYGFVWPVTFIIFVIVCIYWQIEKLVKIVYDHYSK